MTKAYLLYGEEDDADKRILCQRYWIFCNSGEYKMISSEAAKKQTIKLQEIYWQAVLFMILYML